MEVKIERDKYGDRISSTDNGYQWTSISITIEKAILMAQELAKYIKEESKS